MENLGDLLGKRMPKEPDEIRLVKEYISQEFQAPCSVAIKGETLVITVQSAALATMLRLRIVQLQAASKSKKRFVLRIG